MKKILNIILVSCFSLTVISCGLITEEESSDTTTVTVDTAPTASVTTATLTTSENAVVQSTETGTAYLVNTAVTVSNLASITGAADNQSNSVTISSAATNTNLPATGLADGTYKVYAVDAAGNLSSASSNSVTLQIDYALDFDGNDDKVSANGVATELASSTNLPLSVSAWVYPDNGTKQQLIFGFYKRINAFKNGPSVWYGDTNLKFAYYNDSFTTVHSSSTYAINNWHHVVLTIGSDRDGVLYVNGSSALTFSGALNSGGLDMFSIAVDYDSSGGTAGNLTQYFVGKIDEVAVWNVALNAADVTALYNSGNGLKASANSGNYDNSADLIGYWKFNEGTGSTLTDSTSNSNNGTLTNMDSSDWVNTGMDNGSMYYYKVAAVDSSGTGPLSSVASATLAQSIQASETFNGHTYALTSAAMTWAQAKVIATALGGYLTTINTKAENTFLTDEFWTAIGGPWHGANDIDTNNTWVWDNGTTSGDNGLTDDLCGSTGCPVSDATWADNTNKWHVPNQNPNHSVDSCGYIWVTSGGWDDVACSNNKYAIIEFDL